MANSESSGFPVYAGLLLGLLSVSLSAIMIRLAQAPPLIIGAYRLTFASLILTPLALGLQRHELAQFHRRDLLLALLSGLFLGLHFAGWIASLSYTTVASSVVLVSTTPLFVGLFSRIFLRQSMGRLMWYGILVSVLGGVVIGYGDLALAGQGMWGDLLALSGAVTGSAYLIIGRKLRQRYSLLAYITPTYWTAALVLIGFAWLNGDAFLGYPTRTWGLFLLLAIGPQILGHSSLNWTLRHLSPSVVAVSTLAEPILSALFAFLLLAENPSMLELVGGAVILIGIYISIRAELKRRSRGS
jgi:drug/metabolite transporter (DMT)-like permease